MTAGWAVTGALLISSLVSGRANAGHYVIEINHMKFGPAPAQLNTGDVVEWKNRDIFRHTATLRGEFDVSLPPGAKGTITLRTAGTVLVTCRYHPTMTVQLVVKAGKH